MSNENLTGDELHGQLYDAVVDANHKSRNVSDKTARKALELACRRTSASHDDIGVWVTFPVSEEAMDAGSDAHEVKMEDGQFKCDCTGYKIRKVCSHMIAVSVTVQMKMSHMGISTPDKFPLAHGVIMAAILTGAGIPASY